MCRLLMICLWVVFFSRSFVAVANDAPNLQLTLRDSASGELVPGRITVEHQPVGAKLVHHFVKSLDPQGTAVPYEVTRSPNSFVKHTTVSAHPFGATVPPGMYVVSYEHGPEWRGNKAQVWVKEGEIAKLDLPTSRWIDMNERGWYSGDTHVHRSVEELPNVMRAEDLNVALPLSYWIRDAYAPPELADKTYDETAGLITVDPNRVIWPINTEYELFTINGKTHTQGAVFVLNHKRPLTLSTPPVEPIAAEARRQSALLDLDKHSWPWSMMLVPLMDVDLFELANNHIWQTEFFFKHWPQEERPQDWNIETDAAGFTEWGWIDFGFKSYYALLNCGFHLRPTAGTASGVHPVPLGFGRVYVECPGGFSYKKWIENLDAGRSFVTTGPMLFAKVNGQPPGSTITVDAPTTVRVHGTVKNYGALHRIEIIKNGRVVDVISPSTVYEGHNVWQASFDVEIPIETTSWIAVRCFTGWTSDHTAFRFAHSSPVHIEMPGKPLRPRKIEVDYFVRRMKDEIVRNRDILRPEEIAEYEQARDIYARLAETAIDAPITTNEELRSLVIPAKKLPAGWLFTDISKSEFKELGTNPIILSHPYVIRNFPWGVSEEDAEPMNVLRMLFVMYRSKQTEQGVALTAYVCADSASARRTAEFLKAPPNMSGRFRSWHRGDLAISLMASEEMTDVDFEAFVGLVESRLEVGR